MDANVQRKAASVDVVNAQQIASQPSVVARLQVKEVDIQAPSDLNHAFDKKVVDVIYTSSVMIIVNTP